MTNHEALTVLRNATQNIQTTKQGHDLLDQALATLSALVPTAQVVPNGDK